VLELIASCEQAPGSFRLRLLRLELAPEVAALTLTIRGGGGCGGGGGAEGPGLAPQAAVGVGLRLSADRAWGDEAAARLRAALPAFRRLQVLLLRGATPRQEAALAQVRRREPAGAWLHARWWGAWHGAATGQQPARGVFVLCMFATGAPDTLTERGPQRRTPPRRAAPRRASRPLSVGMDAPRWRRPLRLPARGGRVAAVHAASGAQQQQAR
jgi:hypothetical protein